MSLVYLVLTIGMLQWLWAEMVHAAQVTRYRKAQRDRRGGL